MLGAGEWETKKLDIINRCDIKNKTSCETVVFDMVTWVGDMACGAQGIGSE